MHRAVLTRPPAALPRGHSQQTPARVHAPGVLVPIRGTRPRESPRLQPARAALLSAPARALRAPRPGPAAHARARRGRAEGPLAPARDHYVHAAILPARADDPSARVADPAASVRDRIASAAILPVSAHARRARAADRRARSAVRPALARDRPVLVGGRPGRAEDPPARAPVLRGPVRDPPGHDRVRLRPLLPVHAVPGRRLALPPVPPRSVRATRPLPGHARHRRARRRL